MKAIPKRSNGKSNGNSQAAIEAISDQSAKGRRFTPEQKESARRLVAAGTLTRTAIAELMGTTVESLRRWVNEAQGQEQAEPEAAAPAEKPKSNGKQRVGSPYAPRDPGSGLAEHEVKAIVELKQKHPAMGPAQLRAQLFSATLTVIHPTAVS